MIKDLYFKLVDMTVSMDIYLKDAINFMNKNDITRMDVLKKEEQAYEILEDYVLYSERNIIFFDKELGYRLRFFNSDVIKMISNISLYIADNTQFTEKE